MSQNENQSPEERQRAALERLLTILGSLVALISGIFSLLGDFLPSNLNKPIGLVLIGLAATVAGARLFKWNWERAVFIWILIGIAFIAVYLVAARPATVVGSVNGTDSSPLKEQELVLSDSGGVAHTT